MASNKLLDKTVCIVGLGYVGLPLAQDFSGYIRTIGYRIVKRNKKTLTFYNRLQEKFSLKNTMTLYSYLLMNTQENL